jgi:hypothetical protein
MAFLNARGLLQTSLALARQPIKKFASDFLLTIPHGNVNTRTVIADGVGARIFPVKPTLPVEGTRGPSADVFAALIFLPFWARAGVNAKNTLNVFNERRLLIQSHCDPTSPVVVNVALGPLKPLLANTAVFSALSNALVKARATARPSSS